jgi:hypothetical protein
MTGMRDATASFADHFIGLLKSRGSSGSCGSSASNALNIQVIAGTSDSSAKEPLKSEWFSSSGSTGSNITSENQHLTDTGTTGTTDINEGQSNEVTAAKGDATIPDDVAERAAIIEIGAGVPRAWAEGFAQFSLMPPPAGFDAERWQGVINDGGKFIDRWVSTADSLGWQVNDAFDQKTGLVPLINGGEIQNITDRVASIRTVDGAYRSYIRGLGKVGLWNTEPRTVR